MSLSELTRGTPRMGLGETDYRAKKILLRSWDKLLSAAVAFGP